MLIRGLFIIVLGAFSLGFVASPALAYSVNKCDQIAKNDISVAADYVNRRTQRIADEFTHISKDNRDEFVRKWPRVNIVCQDEGPRGKSRICLNELSTGGFAHGGPGNQINICYYNKVDNGDTFCGLVKTLVHETGHSIGVASFENHNNPTNYVRNNDPVYVMGNRAEAFCKADTTFITDALAQEHQMSEEIKAVSPKIKFLDSTATSYQTGTLAEERVVFNFEFQVKHAWVELVDNMPAGERCAVENPEPNDNVVTVVVRTKGQGGGRLRFRVWGCNF